jgi:hypothetical protein
LSFALMRLASLLLGIVKVQWTLKTKARFNNARRAACTYVFSDTHRRRANSTAKPGWTCT